jgi:hypothetical protein
MRALRTTDTGSEEQNTRRIDWFQFFLASQLCCHIRYSEYKFVNAALRELVLSISD